MSDSDAPRRRPRLARLLCLTLTVLGLAYVAFLVVMERAVPERVLLAYVLIHGPQAPLLAPLPVLAVLCLLARQWRLAALNAIVTLTAILLLMPPVLPHRAPRHDPARRVRVVTWNVHCEVWRLPQIQETLARLQPDIVCLQEAEAAAFGQALPGAQAAHTHEGWTLTRGRIVSRDAFPLSNPRIARWGLSTQIELPQGRVSVLNVHYQVGIRRHIHVVSRGERSPIEEDRQRSTEVVLDWLRRTEGPRIVCGDFNTPPRARIYRALRAEATDAFARAGRGWGFTYARGFPLIRIDYVWCDGGVTPVRCRATAGLASDHRLVVTDLLLPPTPSP